MEAAVLEGEDVYILVSDSGEITFGNL